MAKKGYKVQVMHFGTWGDHTKECTTKRNARKRLLSAKKKIKYPMRVKKCSR